MKKILICIYIVLIDTRKTYSFTVTMKRSILYFYKTFKGFLQSKGILYQVIWVPSNTARPTLEGEHSCLPHCCQEEVFLLFLPDTVCLQFASKVCICKCPLAHYPFTKYISIT